MALMDRISSQLSHPRGPGGRLVARLMNRGNRRMNSRAIEQLDVRDGHRVLDLGFGGGLTFDPLLGMGAEVVGLDRASDMVTAAAAKYEDAVASGRLRVAEGDVQALPLDDGSVDRVLTVNTVYFWSDLPAALSEVRRVLAPDGRLVIAIRDGAAMKRVDRSIFTVRPPEEIRAAAESAGFGDVRVESPSDQNVHFIVARAAST